MWFLRWRCFFRSSSQPIVATINRRLSAARNRNDGDGNSAQDDKADERTDGRSGKQAGRRRFDRPRAYVVTCYYCISVRACALPCIMYGVHAKRPTIRSTLHQSVYFSSSTYHCQNDDEGTRVRACFERQYFSLPIYIAPSRRFKLKATLFP